MMILFAWLNFLPGGAIAFAFLQRSKAARYAIAIGVTLLLLWAAVAGLQAKGRADQRRIDQAAAEVAIAKAQARAAAATQAADVQRQKDTEATASLREELHNATAAFPDALPDARRLRRACVQLRQQGLDVNKLPECS